MRLFKLESSQKGSHIHFKEFEILLFKISKILNSNENLKPDQKYFKFVHSILEPKQNTFRNDYKFQIKNKTKSRKRRSNESNFHLPEIVNIYFLII